MKKFDVVCIGQACVDILMKGLPNQFNFDVERLYLERAGFTLGGDATNESKALANMGYSTALVAPLGEDMVGSIIQTVLSNSGVNTEHMLLSQEASTPVSCIFIAEDGERCIALSKDSVYFADAMDISPDILKDTRIVSLASLFLQPLLDPEKILTFVKSAKEAGVIICSDIRAKNDINLDDYREIMPYIDYMFPNYDEAEFYSHGGTPSKAAEYFINLGVKNVIVKTGAEGCLAMSADGSEIRIPAYATTPIDTTGAGDNFAAGFISGLLDGKSIADCCRFACASAHIAIQQVGAYGVIQNKAQVEQVISAYDG